MGVGSLDPGEGWAASAEAGGGGAGRARTATLSGEPRGASVPAPDLALRNLPVPWRCFGVSPGARKPRGGGLPGLRGLRPGLGGAGRAVGAAGAGWAGRATRAERRWRCPQAAGRRGRRAPGHRRPQDERPGHGGAALAAAVPLPGPAAGRPGLRQRGQVGLRSELSASAVLKAGRPPSSFPGVAGGRRSSRGRAGGGPEEGTRCPVCESPQAPVREAWPPRARSRRPGPAGSSAGFGNKPGLEAPGDGPHGLEEAGVRQTRAVVIYY